MTDATIAIVGAGPVGVCAALFLAARGIDSVLLEANPEPAHDLRASTFHPPTLEMLDTIGLATPLIERGLITRDWQVRMHETGERALFDLALLADETPYPFRLQCEQATLVALGLEVARTEAAVIVRLGDEVCGLVRDDDARPTLLLRNGERIQARYVIAADGARSVVRQEVGAGFEGFTYPETTILATSGFPFHEHLAGLSNVNYCWAAEGTFSLLRLPTLWRCSLYADIGESIEDALQPAAIAEKLQRIVPSESGHAVAEIRAYRIHQRIVERYDHGRVLLAGDAAHLNSPSGGMGMNGGIHDAWAAAEAIRGVFDGGDEAVVFARYSRTRKAIAEEQILAQAHRNRTRMQERDPTRRRAELAALQAIAEDPIRCREHLLKTSMIAGLRQAEAMA
ncbi:NAD(P)/FAD-dependent oxidoreductase [Novosphingobium sp. Gsoil 351]|uniref:FAD-dependent oxidoreductase n=1 Tax=Novosphingobium sp. Gsoil 351 TaxID=2675225 RepID=UPI0012B46E35|nr:NAD(P)/FAD-dependent oxidoreductase [Novosphingobium sp. Gsoil 351]QGN55835.1 FAD-dependent oxidoreductase [Novosphingobium sp. Gsoil 351]